MIELRVLGPIELRGHDGRDIAAVLAQTKRLALLVYLAASRPAGFTRRDKLIGLLWPDLEQSRARQALNKTVHHLRQSLGDAAIVSRGDQELAVDDTLVRCDVREFDRTLETEDFSRAIDLIRGPFADGLFVSEAEEFERWMSAERERLRAAAAGAAGALADRHSATNPARAADWARQAVELAPFDEPATRRLMRVLDRAGDAAGAARVYDELVRRLSAELDVAPSAETRALRDSLGEGGGRRDSSASSMAPESGLAPVASPAPLARETTDPPAPRAANPSRAANRRRRPVAAVVAVVVGCVAVAGIGGAIAYRGRSGGAASTLDPNRLFVSVLENRTGDSSFNEIGPMATDWMIEGLTTADVMHVVDSRTAILVNGGGPRTIRQLADASGARLVITGAYYRQGDSLRFQAQLSDAAAAQVQATFHPVVVPIDKPEAVLSPLQDQARTIVAQAAAPQFASVLGERSQPPRYDAYREYMRGVELFVRRDEERAYDHFLAAARIDTTFTEALLNAAASLRVRGSPAGDSLIRVISTRRQSLSPIARLWFDGTEASYRGDMLEATRNMHELARRLPESFFPYLYASDLLGFGRFREADSVVRAIDPDRGWMRGWFSYWALRVMIDDALDHLDAEGEDVAAGARAYPHSVGIAAAAARYIARTGRIEQLDSLFDEASAMPAVGGWDAASVMAIAALEAAAHGNADWLPRIRARALALYAGLQPRERAVEPPTGFGLTWLLASVRAWPELRVRADSLAASNPTASEWLPYLALAAVHLGDTATVRRIDRSLAARLDAVNPRDARWLLADRARVAALLGDRDRAVDLLRQSFSRNGRYSAYLHTDPAFEAIWTYPPFQRLIAPKE